VSRALGVDLGARRIGLALSDPTGTVASPYSVLQRSGSPARDHTAIIAAARDAEADTIVVGLPLSLSGQVGPAARATLDEVEALRAAAEPDGIRVETFDERLTTVIAQQGLQAARMRRDARRRVVDKVAAAVMLQSYLERAR
jgi:putative pre-16S rRNA nuclease